MNGKKFKILLQPIVFVCVDIGLIHLQSILLIMIQYISLVFYPAFISVRSSVSGHITQRFPFPSPNLWVAKYVCFVTVHELLTTQIS